MKIQKYYFEKLQCSSNNENKVHFWNVDYERKLRLQIKSPFRKIIMHQGKYVVEFFIIFYKNS